MIRDRGEYIQLDVVLEKFKRKLIPLKENGKYVLDDKGKRLKQEVEEYTGYVLVPTAFEKRGIKMFGMTPNHLNRVQKTKTTIFDSYSNKFYVVKHTLDEMEQGIKNKSIVGFQITK